jgi:hypothetical protein
LLLVVSFFPLPGEMELQLSVLVMRSKTTRDLSGQIVSAVWIEADTADAAEGE